MNIPKIIDRILKGRDLSKSEHSRLVEDEIYKIRRHYAGRLNDMTEKLVITIRSYHESLEPEPGEEYINMDFLMERFNVSECTVTTWNNRRGFPQGELRYDKNKNCQVRLWRKREVKKWEKENSAIIERARKHKSRVKSKIKKPLPEVKEMVDMEAAFLEAMEENK